MDCRSARALGIVVIHADRTLGRQVACSILILNSLETIPECARRLSRPGLKRAAERAGRCKSGLTRNLIDTNVRLCEPLARFGDARLVDELCEGQLAHRQPPLKCARADVQQGCHQIQCEVATG